MPGARNSLRAVFFASFLFFAHLSVVMYINSTVLSSLVGTTSTTVLYVLGAAGAIALLFALPHIVERFGLVKTTVTICALLTLSLFILGVTSAAATFIAVFVIYTAMCGTVWYCNDLFVAHYAHSQTMGHTRGSYLTINNAAIAIMPIVTGFIIAHHGFHAVYIVGGLLLCVSTTIIAISQRNFIDRPYTSTTISEAWQAIKQAPSLRRVASINFILQFFYVWMTLFTPLYLYAVLHFNWQQIGLAFTIMLIPFVILQYPIGRWADRIGEKKLLIVGFSIAAASTLYFSLLHSHSIVPYIIALFFSRVGICMVEVLAETYFFKQITDRDEGIVSVYRMMYPLAYIIAPLLGWLLISNGSYATLFLTLGLILVIGALYTERLVE
jgi:MFS family permease